MAWSLYALSRHRDTPSDDLQQALEIALHRVSHDHRAPPEVMLSYAEAVAEEKQEMLPEWARQSRAACQLWLMAND